MAESESPRELQASDFTEQRNEALAEGVKGRFLMDGGGAVALLAFLQAIWKDQPLLAKYVVVSIAVLIELNGPNPPLNTDAETAAHRLLFACRLAACRWAS